MGRVHWLVGLIAAAAAGASCGDVARQGRAPVYLVINSLAAAPGNRPSALSGTLASDVITNITSPPPCSTTTPCATVFGDPGQVILSLSMKDIAVSPSSNNSVTITRYHVDYIRTDGRNTPGVDVPYGFDGAITGTISGTAAVTLGFMLVRNIAKEEAPLVQLRNNPDIITTIARITFYGTDQVGNEINVTGQIQVDFGNFSDS